MAAKRGLVGGEAPKKQPLLSGHLSGRREDQLEGRGKNTPEWCVLGGSVRARGHDLYCPGLSDD